MEDSIWKKLDAADPELTRSERRIAACLREDSDTVQYLSITALSGRCDVSEATISRFCRKLGFDSYNEMKIAIAQSNASPEYSEDVSLTPDSCADDIVSLCRSAFEASIAETARGIDESSIEAAVDMIEKARCVYCYGQGASMLMAEEICSRFMTVRPGFYTGGDSHVQLLRAANMTENDLILFVSYSGSTRDMTETLAAAKRRGARILLITHYPDSIGARQADHVLLCGQKETFLESGSIPVKVSILFLADVLVLRYISRHPTETEEYRKRSSLAMDIKYI